MGGFTSALSAIPQIVSGVSMVADVVGTLSAQSDRRRESDQALRALQARQQADYAHAQREAELSRAEIARKGEADEAARQAALKRAVARQQARFGASGISPGTSGSAQALLLGLYEESEEERARREHLDTLRNAAIDEDLAYRGQVNVLQLSDLRERQKIGNLTAWADTVKKLA